MLRPSLSGSRRLSAKVSRQPANLTLRIESLTLRAYLPKCCHSAEMQLHRKFCAPLGMSLTLAAAICGCATGKAQRALAERTQDYVVHRPIAEVWPLTQQVLAEQNFLGFSDDPRPYRLETISARADGTLAPSESIFQ